MRRSFYCSTAIIAVLTFSQAAAAEAEKKKADETVVVTGARDALEYALSPGVVSIAYPEAIKGEQKSLPELLDQIPGVFARRVAGTGQYTTVSVRGSAPSQVNIYVDGMPLNLSSEVAADISTIPISNVERVEVYRGTTPARFSGAPLGGAINIVTKAPGEFGFGLSAGMRSFSGWQGGGYLNAPVPFLGGGVLIGFDTDRSKGDFHYTDLAIVQLNSIVHSDAAFTGNGQPSSPCCYYSNPAIGGDGLSHRVPYSDVPAERKRLNNGYERSNFLLKWQNENFSAKYSYTYLDRNMPAPIRGYQTYSNELQDLPEEPFFSPPKRQQINSNQVALGWHDSFGDLTLAVNLNYSGQNKHYANPLAVPSQGIGAAWSHYQTRRYGASADLTYALGEDWAASHFLEIHAERSRETLHADANGIYDPLTDSYPTDFYPLYRRHLTNFQLQDTVTIRALGDLQVTPVLRLENVDGPILGTNQPLFRQASGDLGWKSTWSLSLKKKFGEGWLVFANSGTYNRYPNFYEIYGDGIYVYPNADSTGHAIPLLRETGRNSDIGFGWNGDLAGNPLGRFLPGDLSGGFRATYFERRTNNAITFFATPVAAKYLNSGSTYTHGFELEGNLYLGSFAELQAAYTMQEGSYVQGTYYIFGGFSAAERVDGKLRTLQSPESSGNARLSLHFLEGLVTTYGEVKHVGKNYVNQFAGQMGYENPLTTFDIGAHLNLPRGFTISAGIVDLFNHGPKQKLKNNQAPYMYTYSTCTDPFDFFCAFDPANYVTDTFAWEQNVLYPRQGRTLFLTVNYKF